jgi:hypothetical protein
MEVVGDINFEYHQKPQAFLNFKDYISFEILQCRKLTGLPSSTVAAGLRLEPPHVVCFHKPLALNWFCKQSAIVLALSVE